MTSLNSSSSSSSPVVIDLTEDEPPVVDKDVTSDTLDMSVYLRELETLRVQNRKLQHENSKLKWELRDKQENLRRTRETLGQKVVDMQWKTSVTLDVPFGASSNSESLTRNRSPSVESVDMSRASTGMDKVALKDACKMEECEQKIKVNSCKPDDGTVFLEQLEATITAVEHLEITSNSLFQPPERRKIDHSNTKSRVSKTGVNSVKKGMSPQRTPITPKESRRVNLKADKSDESQDEFAYLHHNKSYLTSAKTFKIHPPPPDTRMRRTEFANHHGVRTNQLLQFIRTQTGDVKRGILFPPPDMDLALPSVPGKPGLILTSRHEILDNPPWSLFVKCNPAVSIWTYMGEYENVICGKLKAEQFCSLSDKVKDRWVHDFLVDQRLADVYLSMRVRIALRKAGVIPMEDKDEEQKCIDRAKRAVKSDKTEYIVTKDDVIKAISEGEECIDIILMTCTSYDHEFAQHIQQNFNETTNSAPGTPYSNSPKGSMASKTTSPKSAKKKTQERSNSERDFLLDKAVGLSETAEYTRLRPDDVKLVLTKGGSYNRNKTEENDPPTDAKHVREDMDSEKFLVRNSREGSGWVRTLNPKIKLYLVPVDNSQGATKWLLEIVTAARKKCKSRQIPTVLSREALDKLARAQGVEENTGAYFTLMSKSPYNHYETWIETAKYEEYLKLFPHRDLPNPDQLGLFQKLLRNSSEYKYASHRALKQLVSNTEVDVKERELECLEVVDRKLAAGEAAVGQMQLPQILKSEGGRDGNIEEPETFLAIRVNAEKIRRARGKRKGVASQLSVMGTSATEFSKELGWSSSPGDGIWPAPDLTTAEWLHRSAFSWGGLGDPGNIHTSQLRENLMFGTSECNSIMTRYEAAWQQLLIREGDYRNSHGNKVVADGILVTDTAAYIARRSPREPWRSNPITPITPYICSVMEYKLLVQDFRSLQPHSGILKQEFYPFERGFFTVLEHKIDTMILDEMYLQTLDVKRLPPCVDLEQAVSQHVSALHPQKTFERSFELIDLTDRSDHSGSATPSIPENATASHMRALEPQQASLAVEIWNPQLKSIIVADRATALQVHYDVWKDLDSPGPTKVDGIILTNAQMVVGPVKTQSLLENRALQAPPDQFVVKGGFELFGVRPVELYSLQSPTTLGIVQRMNLPDNLWLGNLIPSLANSPLNAIMLCKSTFTYRSYSTLTADAGLTLLATMSLFGVLKPVYIILRDVFGQQDLELIDVSGLIGIDPDCLSYSPTPIGFVLRGELPEMNIKIFNVLEITHLGLDIMANRISSKGGYEYEYGFFGRGRISDLPVQWYIRKHHSMYRILVSTQSESWQNICGIIGVNVENVLFEAAWAGTNISNVSLKVQCTLALQGADLLMRGSYSKNDLELEGMLENCTLETLQQLYEEIFKTKVETKTCHQITFSKLSLVVSTQNGITLHGSVTVDGHTSATATISLATGGIYITGSIESFDVTNQVKLESPSLNLEITSSSFDVQLCGQIRVSNKHSFSVCVYLDKPRGEKLEYAVYGSYQGNFHLRDLIEEVEGTFLDIRLQKVAVCASNMDGVKINVKDNIPAYTIKQGLQVYAQVESLWAVNNIMRAKEACPIILCAYYRPGNGDIKPSFGVDLQVSSTNKMCFDCMVSGPLTMSIRVSPKPSIHIISVLYIGSNGLKLQLSLTSDSFGASGSAELTGAWNNPFDLCKGLTVTELTGELGIEYATFLSTGTPSKVALGGTFELYDFKGAMTLFLGTNPTEQLIKLEMFSLNVAQFTAVICKLLGINAEFSYGLDTFHIPHLLVYISTGVCIQDRQYPRGLELEADMTVLGKKATLHAALTSSEVKLKGCIDAFLLGDAQVSGARKGDLRPGINIEISSKVMTLDINGKVEVGRDHLIVDVHVDNRSGTLYFFFNIAVVDNMKVKVKATLVGSIPQVVKNAEQVRENNRDKKAIKDGEAGTGVVGGLYAEASQEAEQLFDKKFELHALMDQDILDYITKLVNDDFAKEGDPNRKIVLEQELKNAEKELMNASDLFMVKAEVLQHIINDKRTELCSRNTMLARNCKKAEAALLELESSRVLQDQDRRMRAEVDQSRVEEQERQKLLVAETTARTARIAAAECQRALMVQELAKAIRDGLEEAKAAAELELKRFESVCNENAASEPPVYDPGHAPWKWAREELMRELKRKRANLSEATVNFDAICAGFDLEAYKSLTIKSEELDAAAAKADKALASQLSLMQIKIAVTRLYWNSDLQKLNNRLEKDIQSARRAKQQAADAEKEFQRIAQAEQQKLEKANDINTTQEFEQLKVAEKKRSEAFVAFSTFNSLLDVITVFGVEYTAPLRFLIKHFGTKFLNIKKIEITGFWTGKKGSVGVVMDVVICSLPFTFKNIEFDIANIVDLFKAIYMEVGRVINDIGTTWLDIAKQGAGDIQAAVKGVENGVEIALIEPSWSA